MGIAEIRSMTSSERLETMERLWDALCHDPVEPSSPAWHKDVLSQRRERIESGEAKFYTLDEVKSHFA